MNATPSRRGTVTTGNAGRRGRRPLPYLAIVVLTAATALFTPLSAQASTAHPLMISFTFDDGFADEVPGQQLLHDHNMAGTFYINSGSIGQPGYMTRAQLDDLAAQGNEIGGHTVTHQDLLTLSADEQNRQICQDRDTLLSWGYTVTSFAYPFADSDAALQAIPQHCGYNSARSVGNLRSPASCAACPRTESIPPADPYAIRTPDDIESTMTLSQLENLITDAEATGGWIPFNLHHVCPTGSSGCPVQSIDPSVFNQLLGWLQPRATLGTYVRTVQQVLGGPVNPAVAPIPPPAPGAPGVNTVHNPSLETASAANPTLPDCFTLAGYGTNTATQTRVSPGHTGAYASQIRVTTLTDGDAKLVPRFDLGQCSSQVAQGQRYQVSEWYESSVPVFFTLYQRNAIGQWSYWTQSPRLAAASAWTRASWISPVPPSGAVAASFGLTIDSVGTLTTDDYGFANIQVAPAPPGINALKNPSLETPGADGLPQCWTIAGHGDNTAHWSTVTDAATGDAAEQLTLTAVTSGDVELVQDWDSANCAPLVTPGRMLAMSVKYKATAPTFFTFYTQDSSGNWAHWTQSPPFAAAASYTTVAWSTPAVPAGTVAVSFGLALNQVGTVTTDDYFLMSN